MSDSLSPDAVDLSVDLAGLTLVTPVVTASGTCGYGEEYAGIADYTRRGAFTTKSITREERYGNEPPRIAEVDAGLINAIGLANVGLERFVTEKLETLGTMPCRRLVNVAGHAIDDYVAVCERLDPLPQIDGLELNVSCPNVADGLVFGCDATKLRDLVRTVRRRVRRAKLIVKLSPNVTDICEMARAAIDGGADILSMINTFLGLSIDIETWRPRIGIGSGGVSGPGIRPMAVHLVHRVYRDVARAARVPIIGMGGVENWRHAVEMMLAGATAVGVGTALYVDPTTPEKIADGLRTYCARRGLRSVRGLIGGALPPDTASAAG
jgi:dihydroorotate dehydrogenase (NAD+) catalytic subunit